MYNFIRCYHSYQIHYWIVNTDLQLKSKYIFTKSAIDAYYCIGRLYYRLIQNIWDLTKTVMGRSGQATTVPLWATLTVIIREAEQRQISGKRLLRNSSRTKASSTEPPHPQTQRREMALGRRISIQEPPKKSLSAKSILLCRYDKTTSFDKHLFDRIV